MTDGRQKVHFVSWSMVRLLSGVFERFLDLSFMKVESLRERFASCWSAGPGVAVGGGSRDSRGDWGGGDEVKADSKYEACWR